MALTTIPRQFWICWSQCIWEIGRLNYSSQVWKGPWRNAERRNAERWKWRTMGRMPNVIGRCAEWAQCRRGQMPKTKFDQAYGVHMNINTFTYIWTISSFIYLWCAQKPQIRRFPGPAFSIIWYFLVCHLQVSRNTAPAPNISHFTNFVWTTVELARSEAVFGRHGAVA